MEQKWEAKVSTGLEKIRADQIWPLFQDFFGLHKWFPGLRTSYGLSGTNAHPGCVRYCAGFGLKPLHGNSDDAGLINWSKERLTSIDPAGMTLTYEIVDSNIGFNSYVSTIQVVPRGEAGCHVEWSIAVDPVLGWELDDLVDKYRMGLAGMVRKMEAAIGGAAS